jgi:uncharacterized membrane protein
VLTEGSTITRIQEAGQNLMEPKKQSGKPQLALIQAALCGMFAALVTFATFIVQIPNPATKGYLNFGDIIIFVSALVFGPIVGGVAGSLGSAIADAISPYAYYAPFTFVIKGIEGVLAGLISKRQRSSRDIIAVTVAGIEMIAGYFLVEFYPLHFGWGALTEVPINISQILVGGVLGIPIANYIRNRLPEIFKMQ